MSPAALPSRRVFALWLDGALRRLSRAEARYRLSIGRLAARFQKKRGYVDLGFARLSDWARERLGVSGAEVESMARVARALAGLPETERAFVEGEVSWTKVRLLCAVGSCGGGESRWLELARRRTVRELEAEIRKWKEGSKGEEAAAGPGASERSGGAPAERACGELAPAEPVPAGPVPAGAADVSARPGLSEDLREGEALASAPEGAQAGAARCASFSTAATDAWSAVSRVDAELERIASEEGVSLDGEEAARFRMRVPGRVRALFRQVVELARRSLGGPAPVWQCAEAIAAEGLSGLDPKRLEGFSFDSPSSSGPRTTSPGGGPAGAEEERGGALLGEVSGSRGALGEGALGDPRDWLSLPAPGLEELWDGSLECAGGDPSEGVGPLSRASASVGEGGASPSGPVEADGPAGRSGELPPSLGSCGPWRVGIGSSREASARRDGAALGESSRFSPRGGPAAVAAAISDDPRELDASLRRLFREFRQIDWRVGRLLSAVFEGGYERELGFERREDYVREVLGMSLRKAEALVALERAGRRWEALGRAYRSGELSWARALGVLPVLRAGADEEVARRWVARAAEVTLRRLNEEVGWVLERVDLSAEGEGSGRAKRELALAPPPLGVRLGERSPRRMLEEAKLRSGGDRGGPRGRCGSWIEWAGPASVVGLFRVAVSGWSEPGEPRWKGCERLLLHVLEEWARAGRHRDPVFERDDWRCQVPACSGMRELEDHHRKFRSRGGTNDLWNRLAVCHWHHHHGIHAGRIRVLGRAPDALRWQLGLRPGREPFLELVGEVYVSALQDASGAFLRQSASTRGL